MKSLKYFVLLLVAVMLFPVVAFAEGEEVTTAADESDNRAIVYFFHGDGCPHCAEAEEWFESIQEEYGSKFRIQAYEVWNDTDNAALMDKVAKFRNDEATGVPYIICGDKSWIGFDENQMASEIKAQIDAVFATPVKERYDVISLVGSGAKTTDDNKGGNDVLALVIILLVVGGVCFGVYKARESTN